MKWEVKKPAFQQVLVGEKPYFNLKIRGQSGESMSAAGLELHPLDETGCLQLMA
jgi:hypothetical protein